MGVKVNENNKREERYKKMWKNREEKSRKMKKDLGIMYSELGI
jgi:hypothetical protein